jgi:hypothetical protein
VHVDISLLPSTSRPHHLSSGANERNRESVVSLYNLRS